MIYQPSLIILIVSFLDDYFFLEKRLTSAWSYFAKVRDERALTSIQNKFPYSWKVQVEFMNSSEKNYNFK